MICWTPEVIAVLWRVHSYPCPVCKDMDGVASSVCDLSVVDLEGGITSQPLFSTPSCPLVWWRGIPSRASSRPSNGTAEASCCAGSRSSRFGGGAASSVRCSAAGGCWDGEVATGFQLRAAGTSTLVLEGEPPTEPPRPVCQSKPPVALS